MLHCCSRRTVFDTPPPSVSSRSRTKAGSRSAGTLFAALVTLMLDLFGWHRVERLLASIPDSNDDFGIV
ncbi:hypothetical protein [Burkholderia sp. PU8-34]